MTRRQTFRYPQRTRIRALEMAYDGQDERSALQIVQLLKVEGHGDVTRNTVERWLRESAARRATQAAVLGQRLRHEAERVNGSQDDAERILTSTAQLADISTIAAKRALKEIPNIQITTIADVARMASALGDLLTSSVEGTRVVQQLRNGGIPTKSS